MSSAIKFKQINIDDAKLVLDWRSCERVSNFMNSDIEYNLLKQIAWINKILKSNEHFYWIIEMNNIKVGLLYLTNLNQKHKKADWGYYIGNENFLGFGSLVPPYLYNFVFNELHLDILQAKIFYDNLMVIKMHLKSGYYFDPQNDNVIIKNNKPILLISMNLNKSNWNTNKYRKFISNLKL